MKKFMGTLACGFLLLMGSTHANAAFLTDWNYTLSSTEIKNINEPFGYDYISEHLPDKEGVTYQSGGYYHSIEPKHSADVTGNVSFLGSGVSQSNNDVLLRYDTSTTAVVTAAQGEKIADLSFTYTATSAGNEVTLNMTYTIPLYSYYDATSKTAYVYYNQNTVISVGSGMSNYGGDLYSMVGVNLYVDGASLGEKTIGKDTYRGWAINEDTRNYNDTIAKEWVGSFDITSSLVMLGYSFSSSTASQADYDMAFAAARESVLTYQEPAPTPEPATMLLMGLGLLGLGAVARRRKQ